ncbi:MAG: hypothetical protein Q9165_007900 [Trypethelium subeluteriae]
MEDLPREVQLMLLVELAHPRDLHSLIAASPWFLHVFLSHKRYVLASVVRTCIGEELMSHALRAVHAPYLQRALDTAGLSNSLSTSIQLCRLIPTTEPFVTDYFLRAFKETREVSREFNFPEHGFGRAERKSLSYTEYKRIQCAFFNFEEYRRLFGPRRPPLEAANHLPRKVTDVVDTGGEDMENSSKSLTPETWINTLTSWELLNLKSIEDYLLSLMGDIFDELEHAMDLAIRTAAAKDSTEFPPEELRSIDFGRVGLRQFQKDGSDYSSTKALMIHLGLPFVAKFRGWSEREQLSTINSPDLIDAEYQNYISRLQPNINTDDEIDPCSYKDSLDGPSYGVLWNRLHPRLPFGLNCGLTVWDKHRLTELDFLNLSQHGSDQIFPNGGCLVYSLKDTLERVKMREESLEMFRVAPRIISRGWLASIDY